MSVPERKVGFYNLFLQSSNGTYDDNPVFSRKYFIEVIDHIMELPDSERIDNDIKTKKIYALKYTSDTDKDIIKVIFQSGKYGHNPDYLSSIDGQLRRTSKSVNEAEEELTHLCIKLKENKAIILLEERKTGVSAKRIVSYFNSYAKRIYEEKKLDKYIPFFIEEYPVDDIEQILSDITEVKVIDIYANKNELPSEMQRFANIDSPLVREEVMVSIKAERGESIPGINFIKTFTGFKNKSMSTPRKYSRIRIKGKNKNSNPLVFDTDMIRKKEFIETAINSNGIVNSADLFSKMISIMKDVE